MITYIAKKDAKLTKSVLKEYPLISYTILMKLIRNKDIKVNGQRVNKDVDLTIGDKVEIYYNLPDKSYFAQIFCDENVLIINKETGVTSEEIFDKMGLREHITPNRRSGMLSMVDKIKYYAEQKLKE